MPNTKLDARQHKMQGIPFCGNLQGRDNFRSALSVRDILQCDYCNNCEHCNNCFGGATPFIHANANA
eukprot:4166228-Prorocentrum_lima.AAC.1